MSSSQRKWKIIIIVTLAAVSLLGCSFYPKSESAVLSMKETGEAPELEPEENAKELVISDVADPETEPDIPSDAQPDRKTDVISENGEEGQISASPKDEGEGGGSDGWTDKKHYFGSAEFLDGTTAVVAIFSNDPEVEWTDSDNDRKMKACMKKNIGIACDYLASCAAEYGKEADFYYDWDEYPELLYETGFEEHMVEQEGKYYYLEKEFIGEEVDTQGIKERFRARNVIYVFLFNTDYGNEVRPWTYSHAHGEYYDDETINLFVRFDHIISPPATMAHEMLHCFGAPDYYYANDRITEEFVGYCSENLDNDIMYAVNLGDEITEYFSDLTAYYVGLTSRNALVEEWDLDISERAEVIRRQKEALGLGE